MATVATPPAIRFFRFPAGFRRWLSTHADDASEVCVGFYTNASGKGGITYAEALEEALCFGWIDGVRRKAGEDAYMQRFSPHKARSAWSAVNLRRFEARDGAASGFSIADRPEATDPAVEQYLRSDPAAWAHFEAQPPWYRRNASWLVTEAKREDTRRRRLATLLADSAAGRRIGVLDPPSRRREAN